MNRAHFFQEIFTTVLDYSLDLYAYLDQDSRYQYVSNSYAHFYGFEPSQMVGKSPKDVFDESTYRDIILPKLTQCTEQAVPVNYESWITGHFLQEPRYLYSTYLPHVSRDSGEVVGVIVLSRDVSEFKRAEHLLSRTANTDALTNIPNRLYLENKLDEMSASHSRRSDRFALLFIDLDGFKEVNDNFGHAIGDKLLYQVAKRLTKHVRQDDIVARYGGDEFVILITPLYDSDIVKVVRDKIERSLTQPFDVSGNKVNIGVSLGTAIYPDETTDINELLNRADERMYMDKKSKGW